MCDYGWDGYDVGHQLAEERRQRQQERLVATAKRRARADGEYDARAGLVADTIHTDYPEEYMEGYRSV